MSSTILAEIGEYCQVVFAVEKRFVVAADYMLLDVEVLLEELCFV